MRKITLKQLKDAGACRSQRMKFKKMFGEEVVVTQKLCRKVAEIFEFNWAGIHLLNDKSTCSYHRISDKNWNKACESTVGCLSDRKLKALYVFDAVLFAKLYNQKKRKKNG